jgi:hypothetical protein
MHTNPPEFRGPGGTTAPNHRLVDLKAYVEERRRPMPFLQAVISNDLRAAFERGTDADLGNLAAMVAYLYFVAPPASWGSPAAMEAWLATKTA